MFKICELWILILWYELTPPVRCAFGNVWWKAPFFVYFGQFLGTFPIRPVSMITWLLNWIIFRIESAEVSLNWIIFWIESWVKLYWIEYWMNHFLAKFKYWIESDRVSKTPNFTRFPNHSERDFWHHNMNANASRLAWYGFPISSLPPNTSLHPVLYPEWYKVWSRLSLVCEPFFLSFLYSVSHLLQIVAVCEPISLSLLSRFLSLFPFHCCGYEPIFFQLSRFWVSLPLIVAACELSLTHSGSLWLFLVVSLWLSLWLSLALPLSLPVSLWLPMALCDSHSGSCLLYLAFSGSHGLSPCLSMAFYGCLQLPLWLPLALSGSHWLYPALYGSL